ncbi:hypothetical protein Cgig2_014997 [Carnegiea gigantea]|uniref:Uncharacterized protein n=1 Tax=Carnegiea gigantea TaxID=171969 RepID=A0A9Q1JQ95_9CARY|nr:hypothetical protein Cgig2_014997 [Carnegiea gigantea]
MLKEITRSDLLEQKIWYSLKYDKQMLMALEGDMDMRAMSFMIRYWVAKVMTNKSDGKSRCIGGGGAEAGVQMSQTRLRLGEEIINILDEAEISVTSNDAGEEDTTDKGGDEGRSGEESAERNEGNDIVWPRSGLQAGNYYQKLSIWKKFKS